MRIIEKVIVDGKNVFNKPVKNDLRAFDKIPKIASAQDDDYTIECLLDYPYFKKYHKLTAIDLRKLHADLKAIQKINFTVILNREEGGTMFFIIEEVKGTALDFSKGTVKVL